MHNTHPRVFLVAETQVHHKGITDYLALLGAPMWNSDAPSGSEFLIEMMARSCYKSFDVDLNDNLTRVREGNQLYMENILASKHGSVLEHASVSFMFCNVSRVFTHELVRHRAGTAISQESLRFVRLNDLGAWAPTVIRESEEAMEIFCATIENAEAAVETLTEELIEESMPFSEKKLITSAIRRIAPMGLSTNIGWSANFRALRHTLDVRTSPHAEEEIRIVFCEVGRICMERFPNIFQDFELIDTDDGLIHYKPKNEKV